MTSTVGAFLAWDEFGCWQKTCSRGIKALPGITDTRGFHANILRRNLESLFGTKVKAVATDLTKTYLTHFLEQLSQRDDLARVAAMIVFESHAETMIKSLWKSLEKVFPSGKENSHKYTYFAQHVGGDDPAEAYHVAMTAKMRENVVKTQVDDTRISELVRSGVDFHTGWCEALVAKYGGLYEQTM